MRHLTPNLGGLGVSLGRQRHEGSGNPEEGHGMETRELTKSG